MFIYNLPRKDFISFQGKHLVSGASVAIKPENKEAFELCVPEAVLISTPKFKVEDDKIGMLDDLDYSTEIELDLMIKEEEILENEEVDDEDFN